MASRPGKAAGLTTSGPYMTNPPSVLEPLAAISLRLQYAVGVAWNRPVTRNETTRLLVRSRTCSRSPGTRCSRTAAEAGSAAGIGPAWGGAAGQDPASRRACEVTPSKAAASVIGIAFPPLIGSPSGSDQYAW